MFNLMSNPMRVIEADLILDVEDGKVPGMAAFEAAVEMSELSPEEQVEAATAAFERRADMVGGLRRLEEAYLDDKQVEDFLFVNRAPA